MDKALLRLILGVSISGTLGVFVKQVSLSSGQIMAIRTLLGGLLILVIFLIKKEEVDWNTYRSNFLKLVLSGSLFGMSGLFLFSSYEYIPVSIASLIYSLNPVFIFLFSLIFLKESFKKQKFIGILFALFGLVLINGLGGNGFNRGIVYVLISALLYGIMATINKRIRGISGLLITASQILSASFILFTYLYLTDDLIILPLSSKDVINLLILGFIHSGLAMYLYYSSIQNLEAQTVALFSYIEPLSALISSSLILGEHLGFVEMLGGIFILGGALYGEMRGDRCVD